MDLNLDEGEESESLVRFTIALPESEHQLLMELGKLQDDLAKIQGRKRARKWKINRIIQRMVKAQIDKLCADMGADLLNPEIRTQRFAIAKLEAEREQATKNKKKR